ncbi:hypothetical protein [Riemerella columbina]|uniref:hypothetical protein n=1 Tax=Riemerella columbina TaxID=103810 RepID=UPI000476A8FF|nr:hypothetical protein [Riemerella columbina]
MCRYAMTVYKSHYACFECRKTFKRRLLKDVNRELDYEDSVEAKCPQCGGLMADMGLDFESPKMNDAKAWEHLRDLYSVGITFHSCGCSGPGYIPRDKEALIRYFECIKADYLSNLEFWRNRVEPTNKKERLKDSDKNWWELVRVANDYKKRVVTNQEGFDFWLNRVKEVEAKLKTLTS